MDKEEILKQAEAKLPDVNKWEMTIISIPVIKDLPLFVNDEIAPKTSSYYDVRYEKRIDINHKVIWRLIDIYEH
jgi:hypothetical protein